MIKGIEHVGISVADLERSIRFYRELMGMEVLVQDRFQGELYERIFALRGAKGKVALLRAGSLQLELFEFERPVPKSSDAERPVCDHGITHFCMQVEDIAKSYARLTAAGVPFHCPPLTFAEDVQATYGRDPDGNVFELLQLKPTVTTG